MRGNAAEGRAKAAHVVVVVCWMCVVCCGFLSSFSTPGARVTVQGRTLLLVITYSS